MADANCRPNSGFYADINDSYFLANQFDTASAVVSEHYRQYKKVIELGLIEPVEPNGEAPSGYDYAIETPDTGGYAWRIIDRGGELYGALLLKGFLRAEQPNYIKGNASEADTRLGIVQDEIGNTAFLLNSDGIALSSKPGNGVYKEDLSSMAVQIHDAKSLFEAGFTQVYQHELTFEDSQPCITNDREHNQFGVETVLGFVPLVTMLDQQHPVMAQIIQEAYDRHRTHPGNQHE